MDLGFASWLSGRGTLRTSTASHSIQGTLERPLTRSDLSYANEWLDGETFAFLIDFLDASGAVRLVPYLLSGCRGGPTVWASLPTN